MVAGDNFGGKGWDFSAGIFSDLQGEEGTGHSRAGGTRKGRARKRFPHVVFPHV